MTNSTSSSISDASFTKFADAFLRLHREGHAPTVEQAIAEFPELEDEIRQKLPTILLLETAIGEDNRTGISLQPGELVADCIVEKEIARGSFATVYRGKQPELNRNVAIKAMKLDGDARDQAARFSLESRALAKLSHPHIVPVYGFFRQEHAAFLFMKLIDGPSIADLLAETASYKQNAILNDIRSDWFKFANIARDIASGLAHAHSQNLVHRDIKPSNLMLDANEHPWITDFGLAKVFDVQHSLSMTGDIVGTPRYMSPEQLRGECDARSDVYSLGLTLYELATGSHARSSFIRDTEKERNTGQDLASKSIDIPAELQQVIQKCCAFDPNERYQSAAELVKVLDRFITGKIPDRRRGKRKPDKVFQREYRLKVAGTALGSVLVFGLGTYLLLGNKGKQENESDLIATLADTPEDAVATFIKDSTRDSVVRASKEMGLEAQEQEMLVSKFDDLIQRFQRGSEQELNEAAKKFQSSSLIDSTRVLYLNSVVKRSGLNTNDRKRARNCIRGLGYLVAHGDVSAEESEVWIVELVGSPYKVSEIRELKVPDEQILRWTNRLESFIAKFELAEADLATDIKNFFENLEQPSTWQPPAMEWSPPSAAGTPRIPLPFTPQELERIEQGIRTLPPPAQAQARDQLMREQNLRLNALKDRRKG